MRFSDLKEWLRQVREQEIEEHSKKYERLTCRGTGCSVTALVHRRHHAVGFTCASCYARPS